MSLAIRQASVETTFVKARMPTHLVSDIETLVPVAVFDQIDTPLLFSALLEASRFIFIAEGAALVETNSEEEGCECYDL